MYDGILHKPLHLPPGKSDAISSLLVGLLQKDQHRRLGAIADFVSSKTTLSLSVYIKNHLAAQINLPIDDRLHMFCPSFTVRNKEPRLFHANQLGRPLPQKNHSSLQPKRGERGNTSAYVSFFCARFP